MRQVELHALSEYFESFQDSVAIVSTVLWPTLSYLA